MTSTLFVEEIKGRTTGTNANKVIVPSGQTLEVPTVTGNPSFTGGLKVNTVQDTTGTTAMTINTNGIVTKSAHPAFQAYYANNSYVWSDIADGGYHLQTLNQTRFNIGNHYNTTNHRFIAPVAGTYYFYGQYYHNYTSNYARAAAAIFVNGSQMSETWTPCWETTGSAHTAITLSLAVNDYVQLYTAFYDSNGTSNTYNVYGGALNTYLIGHLIG
ncbi:MAG: hypothetical protein CMC59_07655 [Flavobacteriaceae bacterium]|nr:hypothetical protein [Flavobacteriaceae bacterium]|tara:strand:+ start:93 stop:737 length:645 start_codon:yes stop_codon:yes gene_type:complete